MSRKAVSTWRFPGRGRMLTGLECSAFFDSLSRHIDPKPELNWTTPLDLLVAVVLSAQTTDRAVNRVTTALWGQCRDARDYLDLGEEALAQALHSIGLYRNKARAVVGTCRELIDRFGGVVPRTREELESLPGVGRKSANVVLNVGFGEAVMAVDTHVFRVANRTGLARASTPLEAESQLMKRVPKSVLVDAHHYLILHGRYTCVARKPRCPQCPVAALCTFRLKTEPRQGSV